MLFTAERTNEKSTSDNPIYQRHLFAYENALPLVSGNVLEVGCGEGYGSKLLAPHAAKYTAIDKFVANNQENFKGIEFVQVNLPYIKAFADNTFDLVVSFQVIEHIEDDHTFLKEINRVLKPGGKLIMTTPNIKMSLTRNPYHIREYTYGGLAELSRKYFKSANTLGIYGDDIAMKYFEQNKKSVERITRFDIFKLQYRLPRQILRVPYDILNRVNRLRLNKENTGLVADITTKNFFLKEANDLCIDLFYILEK